MQFAMSSIKEYQQSTRFWAGLARRDVVWEGLGKATVRAGHGFGKGTASAVLLKAAKNAGFSP